jgi:hypothetical protein
MLDFVQEDIETMKKELASWKTESATYQTQLNDLTMYAICRYWIVLLWSDNGRLLLVVKVSDS